MTASRSTTPSQRFQLKAGTLGRRDPADPTRVELYDPLTESRLAAARPSDADAGTAAGGVRVEVEVPLDAWQRHCFESPQSRRQGWNLELSGRFTLSCRHCYQRPVKCEPWETDSAARDFPLAEIAACEPGEVSLSGGEVLLAADLPQRIRQVRAALPSVPLRILLSGTAMAQRQSFRRLVPLLAEYRILAKVPIYSCRAARHDEVTRSPGSLADALEAIDRLQRASVEVSVSYLILGPAADDAPRTVGMLRQRVGERFSVSSLVYPPRENATPDGDSRWRLDPARLRSLLESTEFAALPVEYLSFESRCGSGCRFPTMIASGQWLGCAVYGGSACGHECGNGRSLLAARDWRPEAERLDSAGRCGRCSLRTVCKRCPAFVARGPAEDYCRLVRVCADVAAHRIRKALGEGMEFLHEHARQAWELWEAAGASDSGEPAGREASCRSCS